MARATRAASVGAKPPEVLSPSVIRIMTRDPGGRSRSFLAARAMASPRAVPWPAIPATRPSRTWCTAMPIHRQGRQDEGLAAEDDEPGAIPLAGVDEAPHDPLDHRHAGDLTALGGEVQGVHGVGGVHPEHQVVARGADLGVGGQPFRAHQGHHQGRPQQVEQGLVDPARQLHPRPSGLIGRLQVLQVRVEQGHALPFQFLLRGPAPCAAATAGAAAAAGAAGPPSRASETQTWRASGLGFSLATQAWAASMRAMRSARRSPAGP